MAGPTSEASLQVLFGKAFLVELQRGDLETAKLFARAFLLGIPSLPTGPELTLATLA